MQLIKYNPFRIIGVLAGITTREEHTKVRKLKMYVDAEQEIPVDYFFPVLGNQSRSMDQIEKATSKLNLNDDRIIAALFWFYEGNKVTDEPAFDSLKEDDLKEAIVIWEKLTKSSFDVTQKNASAYNNLGTVYLSKNKFKKGLNLKLAFLESDYATTLISKVTDETFKVSKIDLQIRFLEVLFKEVKDKNAIEISELLEIIDAINFSAKNIILEKFVDELIKKIEAQINDARIIKTSEKSSSESIILAGEDLVLHTSKNLKLIKTALGKTSIKFTNIADKIANEILNCSVVYFKRLKDSKSDPSDSALGLMFEAKKIAEGLVTKQRIQENIENLQEWIEDKPERDKQNKIAADFEKIIKLLKRYDEKAETISNADDLVDEARPLLNNIKSVLGSNDDLYLKLSTRIANQALSYIIEEVNQAQNKIEYQHQVVAFKLVLRSAILLVNKIKTFDLEYNFKVNRLNENYDVLAGLCSQLNVSTSGGPIAQKPISSPTNTPRPTPQPNYTPPKSNSDNTNWGGWIFGIILFIIVVKSCNAANNNNGDNNTNYDAAVDTTAVEAVDTAAYEAVDTMAAPIDTTAVAADTTTIAVEPAIETSNLSLSDINGTWYGMGEQFNNNSSWSIKLTINSVNDNYKIEYPSSQCVGYFELLNEHIGYSVFKERIYKGNCIDNLRAELYIIDSEHIKIKYYYDGTNEYVAVGNLTK